MDVILGRRTDHLLRLFAAAATATALAGCGFSGDDDPAPAAAPAFSEREHQAAVRDFYGTVRAEYDPQADEFGGATEEQFHQPPDPLQAAVGDAITLTGTNLGVRMRVKVLGVDTLDGGRAAVRLELANDGIAIFESELTAAELHAGGRKVPVDAGERAGCSNGFDEPLRLDVGDRAGGCLVFDVPEGASPSDFLLALEQVPAEAGGRWRLG